MFWIDELLEKRTGKEWINDSWTPSGIVHMGSLKGPIIHDTIFRILKAKGTVVKFTYGFDDMDPIDGLPPELRESHQQYLGVPIYLAPSPDGNGTFGDFYGRKMLALLSALDIKPELYKTSDLYKNGTFNKAIQFVLDHADKVRGVYSAINKKTMPDTWFPMQVICEQCSKLGTTKVSAWDGNLVTYTCEKAMVEWATGCGNTGKISPFDGNGKMPWKVEWAAKWWTFGVTIEGAGKDHASAGGSYDVAMKICDDVFQTPPPLKIAYEFFLAEGKKMSSSKGLGLTGEQLLEVLSPEAARFLMIYKEPNTAIEFSPRNTYVIPKLFDEYQKAFTDREKNDEAVTKERYRAFELSQISGEPTLPSLSFGKIATLIQMPNLKHTLKEYNAEQWAAFATVWIEKYAPETDRLTIAKDIPASTAQLSEKQKAYLLKVAQEMNNHWTADDLQVALYEWAKTLELPSKDAFAAIYAALIDKNHGPRAAWLILDQSPTFIIERFTQAARNVSHQRSESQVILTHLNKPEIFSIDKTVRERYPSMSVGIAIIKNVSIQKSTDVLEKEKAEMVTTLQDVTTERLGLRADILSYRKLYKEMKVDWHSRRPSPEALLRRVALKKGLYTVNTCVDAYNLVVMKHGVSVGAFDLDTIAFPTVLRFAKEGEEILLLGDQEPTKYKDTELAYFDEKGGYNIDFNYRDAQRTAVKEETKNLYINVDGIYDITPEKVQEVLQDTCEQIIEHCGGTLDLFGIVSASE